MNLKIDSLSKKIEQAKGKRDQLQKQLISVQSNIESLKASIERKTMAKEVLDKLVELENKSVIGDLERLVTDGIRSIWGGNYEFKVVMGNRGDSTTAQFKLFRNGKETSIMDAHGGGMVQVVAFLARLILLLKIKPKLKQVLLLDEPFVYLSQDYHSQMADLLGKLVKDLGIKLLMVTHQPIFAEAADHEYRLTSDGEKTNIRSVR